MAQHGTCATLFHVPDHIWSSQHRRGSAISERKRRTSLGLSSRNLEHWVCTEETNGNMCGKFCNDILEQKIKKCKVPNLAAVSPGPTFTVKASFGASRNIDLRSQKDYKSARISGDWTASTSPGHDPPLPATVRFLAERGTHLFCHLHIWESRRRASPHCFALWCQSSKVWSMKAWLQTSARRITFPHTSLQPDLPRRAARGSFVIIVTYRITKQA